MTKDEFIKICEELNENLEYDLDELKENLPELLLVDECLLDENDFYLILNYCYSNEKPKVQKIINNGNLFYHGDNDDITEYVNI